MKVATFNINNINRRLPNLLRWLHQAKPDIVCLQELKSADDDFPAAAIDKAGYGAVWRGQRTWNGVAILARNADPVLIKTELPGDPDDHEHFPGVPGIHDTVAISGQSILLNANAPNFGAIYLMLDPFEERTGPGLSGDAIAAAGGGASP